MRSTRPRRILSTLALAAAAVVTLAACSGSGAAADAPKTKSSSYTVSTLYGDVSVPAGAKRIVAYSFPEATALADLGIKPVGIGTYIPAFPAYTSFFKGVPDVTDSSGAPDLEKVAALKPDLIVGDEFETDVEKNRGLYEKLSSIAPTVMLKWTQAAGNWPADAAGTAQAVGKTAELNKLKSAYEAKAADIKRTYADVLSSKTVDLISANDSAWFLYGDQSSHGKVLAAAGARFAAAAGQKDGFAQYSPEKYSDLANSDILVVSASAPAAAAVVTSNPVFAALPAAQAGHVYTTPYFFPSSYRIADALLDDFAAMLEKAK
ncbi:ABC transporter substrate-binding protein [Gryllotalpicola koreensis]|uniref:Fe/B12 periplasmic-binding domain-containing protein n=1 Tax=Gryllotalpicola koreensis TaxID=993086 RepID=A0ABP7ZUF3_9MICO